MANVTSARRIRSSNAQSFSLTSHHSDTFEEPICDGSTDIGLAFTYGTPPPKVASSSLLVQPTFETQLYRTRVYRHAANRHSQSSISNDGRSTLAISLSSSLTLGEVSNISVYALPIYAYELSNANCYYAAPILVSNSSKLSETTYPATTSFQKISTRLGARLPSIAFESEIKPSRSKKLQRLPESSLFHVPLQTALEHASYLTRIVSVDNSLDITVQVPFILVACGWALKAKG